VKKEVKHKRSFTVKKGTDLNKMLVSLDGQKYGAYKRVKGMYQFEQFRLAIDHVQVDPFAPPSKMRILISRQTAGIPNDLLDTQDKVTAVADFLTRNVKEGIQSVIKADNGKPAKIFIDSCGQEILTRSSVVINEQDIEVRLEVGLPAAGRKILGKAAAHVITTFDPYYCRPKLTI
jgi:predicted ABC-class ATPase